jgi:hypothetical protein
MERRRSFGDSDSHHEMQMPVQAHRQPEHNYPGNLCFWPRTTFKMTETIEDMDKRQRMLTKHALLITKEGPMGV